MGFSKITFDNTTMIDLTSDTVSASVLLQGYTAHGADGELIVGTMTQSDTYVGTSEPVASDYEDGDIYLKVEKVYKKVNGSMVEQDITTAFDSNTNYVRG